MNIGVIGAGLTGLTAALRLTQQGHRVTILEASDIPGGLAAAFQVGSDNLDRFYHHIFTSDKEILNLIDELSLTHCLGWYEPKNAIYIEDSLHPFTTPMDLLRFRPLSLISRIRMGWLVLSSKFIKDYKRFESITAKEWIIRHSGKDAFNKVWNPLLKSKFDVDADSVSGTWIWNKFKLRGSSRGKNISKERLGYLDGGFATLIYRIIDAIEENGGKVRLNSKVIGINKTANGLWEVSSENSKILFEKLLFTASPELLSMTFKNISISYCNALKAIKYKANLCLTLELYQSVSPYYWITIAQQGFPFVLAIEHTNLVGQRSYGAHILYLSRYLDSSDPLFSADDEEISAAFLGSLSEVLPNFNLNVVRKMTLNRSRYAQPVVNVGYKDRMPCIKTPEDGLYLASMSQIYPEDRGLNYAVRLGNQAVYELLNDLN